MRPAYQPCKAHQKTYCSDSKCKAEERDTTEDTTSNVGTPSINSDGHLAIGLGSGLAIDTTDGSLGFQVGGFTIDT